MSQGLTATHHQGVLSRYDAPSIRVTDMMICALALPLLAPCFLVIALAIKLTSPGPSLYKAKRVGRHGKLFDLYKFRTMVVDADHRGPAITVQNDPRVTTVGRFLRRVKLDELPQILNVLRGDMSLVGPRPEDPRYVALYTDAQRRLLSVRPGITSPASLHYSAEETLLSGKDWESDYVKRILPHKLAIDADYVQHYSLRNYLSVLFATVVKLLGMPRIVDVITNGVRNRHIFGVDLLLLSITPLTALVLRQAAWRWLPDLLPALLLYTVVALIVKLTFFYQAGLYRRYWRYTSMADLGAITTAVALSTLALFGIVVVTHPLLKPLDLAIYRTLPLIDGMLTGLVVTGGRLGLRVLDEWRRTSGALRGRCPVIIVGADAAGTLTLRQIKSNPDLDMAVVAFIDDDPAKIDTKIAGVPVVGPTEDVAKHIVQHEIQQVLITATNGTDIQEIEKECRALGVKTAQMPGISELLSLDHARRLQESLDFNQLLNRPPTVIDIAEVARLVAGTTVLITGAGGSIGSELCRQLAQLNPASLILLGHGEHSIFQIGLELRTAFPDLCIHQIIADVRDTKRIHQIVDHFRPHIIYHAAAHKHVPLMQASVEEAITNNVLGTRNVLQAAEEHGVPYFVLISTDKAINPTSMMGASKRIAELLVQMSAQRSGRTYQVVRFGNVLGSRGSVIPIFQRQIAAGGPVTITHHEMTRYFMTIPEAVQLVLQATVLGEGGEIFVLDMGEPVRILDLARGLIQMAGYRAEEIDITFSGIRPGEKLHEDLFRATEHHRRTTHNKIFVATECVPFDGVVRENQIAHLIVLAQQLQTDEVIHQVNQIIGSDQPGSPQAVNVGVGSLPAQGRPESHLFEEMRQTRKVTDGTMEAIGI